MTIALQERIPREPTEAMLQATAPICFTHEKRIAAEAIWIAMYDAALGELAQHAPQGETTIDDDMSPPEKLASHLIDVWCANHDGKIPWDKAVKISAIVTKMPDTERDRLLTYGNDDGAATDAAQRKADAERIAELERDAARYRWLRSHHKFCNDSLREIWFDAHLSLSPRNEREFDDAIDAESATLAAKPK